MTPDDDHRVGFTHHPERVTTVVDALGDRVGGERPRLRAGCWRYDPKRDREECIVCGAVRAPRVVTDGGQVVSEPDADLDALQRVSCVNCDTELGLAETARFARVDELDSGWLCEACDAELCGFCDGRGWIHFTLAGRFDRPECAGGDGT